MTGHKDLKKWAKEEFAHAIVARYERITGTGAFDEPEGGVESTTVERKALRNEMNRLLKHAGYHLTMTGLETSQPKVSKRRY